ncbi:MAG: cell envelope integrity protein CreD [Burkholderiaceae bacterium]|jgi:inner membrane protein|nr:cell envelope integrity protein CreD [Burkholderiaceae bacterium]
MSKLAAFKHSMLAKCLILVLLLLLLCIPLAQISWLIDARGQSANQAAEELRETYVGPQTLTGPLIVVPYIERWQERERDEPGQPGKLVERSAERVALWFPQQWSLDGEMTPEQRYRGLFTVLFYRLNGAARGQFAPFDRTQLVQQEKNSRIEVGTPVLTLHVSDLRGLQGVPRLSVVGEPLSFTRQNAALPASSPLAIGIHAPLTGAALDAFQAGRALPFTLELALAGQQYLGIVPVGDDTEARLHSTWPHPSFGGRFLAAERSVGEQGFDARWRIAALASQAREQLRALPTTANDINPLHNVERFEVSLVQPVNVYSMSARAMRYDFLFVALTLLAVLMVELFARLRLHPVQYALVGLSIAVFFLLLIALSEKIGFAWAYAGAAGASVALLALYFSAVLRSLRRALLLAGFVAVLYGTLYGLLASESHALMLGALLVFGMVATLMLATRHVDWWTLGGGGETARP